MLFMSCLCQVSYMIVSISDDFAPSLIKGNNLRHSIDVVNT